MNNEKLEQAAHRYADIVKKIKDADRRVSAANSDRATLISSALACKTELKGFVGNNIKRKAIVIPGGIVVTVEFVSEKADAIINVYENGEEIFNGA